MDTLKCFLRLCRALCTYLPCRTPPSTEVSLLNWALGEITAVSTCGDNAVSSSLVKFIVGVVKILRNSVLFKENFKE